MTLLAKDSRSEVKRQLEKCKIDQMSYLAIIGGEHYPSEIGWREKS